MSHPVIHKTDIGKVKTSNNVMKLLKLLLTVIVKHPVLLANDNFLKILKLVNEIFLQMAIVYKLLCSPNSANESVLYLDNTGCRLTCASGNHAKLTVSFA